MLEGFGVLKSYAAMPATSLLACGQLPTKLTLIKARIWPGEHTILGKTVANLDRNRVVSILSRGSHPQHHMTAGIRPRAHFGRHNKTIEPTFSTRKRLAGLS